jgi:hypothetical protein
MITMTLKPLKLPNNPLKTVRGIGTYTGWLTLVIIILAVPIAVYYRYRTSGALCPTQHEKTAVGDGCIQGYSALGTCWKTENTEKDETENEKHEKTPFPIEDTLANACRQENYTEQMETDKMPSNKRKRSSTDRDNMKIKRVRAAALDREIDHAVETVMRRPTAPPAWAVHTTQI